jgi:catechol 2,3-dioxygenase-like lactoylglutathione lyase family enzyme
MRINLSSVLVDDQEKALRFYTEVLGFVKMEAAEKKPYLPRQVFTQLRIEPHLQGL